MTKKGNDLLKYRYMYTILIKYMEFGNYHFNIHYRVKRNSGKTRNIESHACVINYFCTEDYRSNDRASTTMCNVHGSICH